MIGAVATRSGASSPEIDKPGEPAGELPRRHHQHRHQQHKCAVAVAEGAPQHQRGRQQIEDLHQRLRDEPGIAQQQRPFLPPQRARAASGGESRATAALAHRRAGDAGGRDGVLAERAGRTARSTRRACRHRTPRRRRARRSRPAPRAPATRRRCRYPAQCDQHPVRLQGGKAGQRAVRTGSRRSAGR